MVPFKKVESLVSLQANAFSTDATHRKANQSTGIFIMAAANAVEEAAPA
jgi:hypothetical protein